MSRREEAFMVLLLGTVSLGLNLTYYVFTQEMVFMFVAVLMFLALGMWFASWRREA